MASASVIPFPKRKKCGPKVRKGPCAQVIALQRAMPEYSSEYLRPLVEYRMENLPGFSYRQTELVVRRKLWELKERDALEACKRNHRGSHGGDNAA